MVSLVSKFSARKESPSEMWATSQREVVELLSKVGESDGLVTMAELEAEVVASGVGVVELEVVVVELEVVVVGRSWTRRLGKRGRT